MALQEDISPEGSDQGVVEKDWKNIRQGWQLIESLQDRPLEAIREHVKSLSPDERERQCKVIRDQLDFKLDSEFRSIAQLGDISNKKMITSERDLNWTSGVLGEGNYREYLRRKFRGFRTSVPKKEVILALRYRLEDHQQVMYIMSVFIETIREIDPMNRWTAWPEGESDGVIDDLTTALRITQNVLNGLRKVRDRVAGEGLRQKAEEYEKKIAAREVIMRVCGGLLRDANQ